MKLNPFCQLVGIATAPGASITPRKLPSPCDGPRAARVAKSASNAQPPGVGRGVIGKADRPAPSNVKETAVPSVATSRLSRFAGFAQAANAADRQRAAERAAPQTPEQMAAFILGAGKPRAVAPARAGKPDLRTPEGFAALILNAGKPAARLCEPMRSRADHRQDAIRAGNTVSADPSAAVKLTRETGMIR